METSNRSLLFCATLCICLLLGTSHLKQRRIPVEMLSVSLVRILEGLK